MTDRSGNEKGILLDGVDRPAVAALIVAAGRGHRAGGGIPKQYRSLAGRALLRWTVQAFMHHSGIDRVQVVIHPDDRLLYDKAVEGLDLSDPVPGGATRQESVRLGLEALSDQPPDIVLIHDAARPFVIDRIIDDVIEAVGQETVGAIPALAVTDTLKRGGPTIEATVARDRLWRAQTPQAFLYDDILKAHQMVMDRSLTDDSAVAEAAALPVRLVPGDEANIKLTTAADFAHAAARLEQTLMGSGADYGTEYNMNAPDIRTGFGFDVHAFEEGDHVWLCGVKIEHSRSLKGHSDADAGLHAITDALLGATGGGDIGQHFPPSDARWRDADSQTFLSHAAEMCRAAGGRILNVDVTLICEAPKIGPHKATMVERISDILGIAAGRVNVKATTSEGLGFVGRDEGLAAQAVVTVHVDNHEDDGQ